MNEYEEQAKLFMRKHHARLSSRYIGFEPNHAWDGENSSPMHHWKCRLNRNGINYHFDFWKGVGCGPGKPTYYDVLSCLEKYDIGTFDDFCSEFGYNTHKLSDYPRIKKIYLAVQKEYAAMQRLFGDCMEELREIN